VVEKRRSVLIVDLCDGAVRNRGERAREASRRLTFLGLTNSRFRYRNV